MVVRLGMEARMLLVNGDGSMRMIIVVVVCDEKLWESKLKRVAEGKW